MTSEALLVELPVRPESAASARRALAGFRRHLDLQTYVDMRWVVSELVADAILGEGEETVNLEIAIRDGELEIAVTDGASAYRLRSRRPALGKPGWGVHLARILGPSWGTRHEDGQGSVWVRAPLAAS